MIIIIIINANNNDSNNNNNNNNCYFNPDIISKINNIGRCTHRSEWPQPVEDCILLLLL